MKQHTSPWHTSHMAENKAPENVWLIRNRSGDDDAVRLVVHKEACAMCAAHIAEVIWPVGLFMGFDMTKMPLAKQKNDKGKLTVKARNVGNPSKSTARPR